MVQNYLGSVRRTLARMSNYVERRREALSNSAPRRTSSSSSVAHHADSQASPIGSFDERNFIAVRTSMLNDISTVAKSMQEFTTQWTRLVGRQQSPLIDRIPPRGVELWRDFWDTVRRQVRRINQEFYQLSQDMSRMLTGRLPSTNPPPGAGNPRVITAPINMAQQSPAAFGSNEPADMSSASLLYSASAEPITTTVEQSQEHVKQLAKRFQEFYDRMTATLADEQQKMDAFNVAPTSGAVAAAAAADASNNLVDELDDEQTRQELDRNVALRQQIQQEINVFGSIFDIMRAFIQRLRESANNIRDVMQPSTSNNNNNDAVTPGPQVKPQVDKLLDETIDSQRNINGQAKPVLMPNVRPINNPQTML